MASSSFKFFCKLTTIYLQNFFLAKLKPHNSLKNGNFLIPATRRPLATMTLDFFFFLILSEMGTHWRVINEGVTCLIVVKGGIYFYLISHLLQPYEDK